MASANVVCAQVSVTTTTDAHASSPSSSAASTAGGVSLRSAIEYADYHSGTTITVPSGTYNLTLGEIQIGAISSPTTTTINGGGAGSTIVKQTDGTNRIFDIDPGVGGGITCTITGMTIEDGQDKNDQAGGGGIIDGSGGTGTSDRLTLTNCSIQNNTAYGGSSFAPYGGGLQMSGGYLTITNCTFSNNVLGNNSASGAGAGAYYSAASSSETLTISNSTFTGNVVDVGSSSQDGAGLAITGDGGTYSITNSTFSNNSFSGSNTGDGGAIYTFGSGTLTITGCAFVSNSASGTGAVGGAIDIDLSTTISYSRFSGNSAPSVSNVYVSSGTTTANNDWWASNSGPGTTEGGVGTFSESKYIKLTNTAARSTINSGDTTKLTASFLTNSDGSTNSASNLGALSGLTVSWGSPVLGALSNQKTSISNGIATATFKAGATAGSNGSAQATVDGVTATTSPTITVDVGASVTTNPTNQTVNAGQGASFTAVASGNPTPTVQWQVSTNGGSTWTNISGATSTTYSFTTSSSDNGKEYRAAFTNSVSSDTSTAATLTVDFAPAVTTNPSNDTVTAGSSAAFTAAATGNPAPTVQWQVSTDGGTTWSNVSGATSTTLTFTSDVTENGYKYEAVFTNSVSSATSNPATLVVKDMSLAVQVSSFKAAADYNSVTLTWQTQSEVENAGFNILKRQLGVSNWQLAGSYTSDDSLRSLGTSTTGHSYDFTDNHVVSGSKYQYEIQSVSTYGFTKNIDTIEVDVAVPKDFSLYQNYPNPFNPSTTVRFDLKEQSNVTLGIYNVLGQQVEYWNYGMMGAGRYNENINMSRFASGVYFYRIVAQGSHGGRFVSVKKLELLK